MLSLKVVLAVAIFGAAQVSLAAQNNGGNSVELLEERNANKLNGFGSPSHKRTRTRNRANGPGAGSRKGRGKQGGRRSPSRNPLFERNGQCEVSSKKGQDCPRSVCPDSACVMGASRCGFTGETAKKQDCKTKCQCRKAK
ncbi:unnamed protein product [Clonostachys rhizophaga]|uniref:Uncharacterized protein n=1 Tax=Clonostachys rhizophaga TaxID=160324 RepID=A0A9N9VH13_9HYPO|nr:unnamed protein product [Clonostachys rhizophaga]